MRGGERGASLLEYGLLASLILLAVVIALPGEDIACALEEIRTEMVDEMSSCHPNYEAYKAATAAGGTFTQGADGMISITIVGQSHSVDIAPNPNKSVSPN